MYNFFPNQSPKPSATKSKKKENPIQEKKEPKIGEITLSTRVPHEAEGAGGLSEAWTMLFRQALVDHLPEELNNQIRRKTNPTKNKKTENLIQEKIEPKIGEITLSTQVPHEAEGVGGLSEAWTMLFRQALVDHV